MKRTILFLSLGLLMAQTADKEVVSNPHQAKWQHDAGDPPGSESVLLREDAKTGAMEMFVRFPAGHVFSPHWHSANERIILLEGKMSVEVGGAKSTLEPGGYAYMPAKQVQRLACTSSAKCMFYLYWDGKLDFHRAAAQ